VALPGVVSAVRSDAGDFLIGWDMAEQLGQHRRIPNVAAGDLDGANFQCLLINPEVDLPPDAAFGPTVLARVPFPFALNLDPSAVDQQMQRPLRAPMGDIHGQCLLPTAEGAEIRHRPVQANQAQQALDKTSRLPRRHRARTDGATMTTMPKRTFIVRQVWTAASL